MQDFVAFVSGEDEPPCRGPHLRWVVRHELIDHDFVQRKVRVEVDVMLTDTHAGLAATEGVVEFGVFGFDEQRPVVFVVHIEVREVDTSIAADRFADRETKSGVVAHTTTLLKLLAAGLGPGGGCRGACADDIKSSAVVWLLARVMRRAGSRCQHAQQPPKAQSSRG